VVPVLAEGIDEMRPYETGTTGDEHSHGARSYDSPVDATRETADQLGVAWCAMTTVAESLSPDDVDLSFVARVVPELEIATVGNEQVVIGGATQLVVLNQTAALIFQFLDGEATLGELVDDFAEALDLDRAVVEDDVLTFVRDLGANGLLEGVELPAPEMPEWFHAEPVVALEPGDEVDDFTLPDLHGTERSLADSRGKRTLLVNWSPGCGFCVKIADELAALHPLLAEHDVELVLVAMGGAEANRTLHAEHGLVAPTLLRDGTGVDPFRGTGTPAAYLIAADGTLAEAMAVGANQVPALARDLAGVDPAVPYGTVAEGVDADDVRGAYLPAPGAMCGPGGGGGASSSTDWQGTRAYAVGGYHVGIRYDDADTAALLDRFFDGALVNDRRVPDNYSVALGSRTTTKGAGASRALKLLVHGSSQLVRSRSGGRVLNGLLQYLDADVAEPDPSLTRVSATAMVRDGDAVLLPARLVDFVKQLQPRLAKIGLSIVDSPRTLLDLQARELVVPEPSIPHDASLIAELDDGVKLGGERPWIRPGRYPLRTWLLARGPAQLGPLSPALAVTGALPMLFDLDDLVGAVERFADLFTDVRGVGIWYANADELTEQVDAALR
jgi:peroxiredoxin